MNTSITFITFLLIAWAQDVPHNQTIEKIEFTTLIRGAHEEVLIIKDCVSIVKQGFSDPQESRVQSKILNQDWQKLLSSIKEISLDSMRSFPSPTNKRAYDGAWHSSLVITTSDKKSYRHSFDNEEPDERLKPLMKAIRELTEKVSK